MDIIAAVKSMGALAQTTRLEAFRLVISEGPDGMPAGEIATALQVPHNTLSSHLTILVQSGLMQSRRVSRSIIYSVNEDGIRELLDFLLQDCCKGNPELCTPQKRTSRHKSRKGGPNHQRSVNS